MAQIEINSTWVTDRFNLQYNNIFSNRAPGIELSEISIYLTMAHIEIIDEYSANLDLFEKNRSMLTGYIYDDTLPNISGYSDVSETTATTGKTRDIDYQVFSFTKNYWKILKEYAITNSNSLGIPIKPITYDGFNTMSANPFKWPNGMKGWRLDINYDPLENSNRDVKVFYKKQTSNDYIKKYEVTYLILPEKFNIEATIEADRIPSTLSKNPFLAEKIINRAVELTKRDYEANELQTQVQINKRSE